MAFNFGAFAAGFAQSAERSILQQTQRRDEEEDYKKKLALQFEYDQKAADAAAGRSAAASRRAKQEELDALAQSLSFYGLTSEQVQAALAGGKFAAEQAINMAANLRTAGKNPSDYFRVAAAATSAEDYSNSDFTETVNGMTLSLGRPEVSEITTGQGLFDWEKYTADMSPTTIYDSYADGLASISSRQLRLDPDSAEYAELQRQKAFLLDDLAAFKDAEREKGNDTTGSIWTTPNLISEQQNAYKLAAQTLQVPVDIETNMMQLIEGKEGVFYSAELEAARILESNWKNTGEETDTRLQNTINTMRDNATRNIENYARSTYYGETDTSYRKNVNTIEELDRNISRGAYNVGDVVVVTSPLDSGEIFIVAITNTPNYSAAATGMGLQGKNVMPIRTEPREY